MTQEEMKIRVPQKLEEIEREYDIRVLYAAESGSRAWGTCRGDSDFDVRFIFIRPLESYLKLEEEKDVLEFPIEDSWDMCGWDLRKLLKLLHNANTQIYEWFASPVVYVDKGFSRSLRPLLEEFFSKKTACYHYLHQADLKNKKLFQSPRPKVKHYLYILQHLGCVSWVLQTAAPVPVDYAAVTAQLPEDLREAAAQLLARKLAGEKHMDREEALDKGIGEERARLIARIEQLPREAAKEWESLDRFFLEIIGGAS